MNRDQLQAILRREGVRDDVYVLEGDVYSDDLSKHPRTYIGIRAMIIVEGGWAVVTFERGAILHEMRFDTEDEACQELLTSLLKDPTTREHAR